MNTIEVKEVVLSAKQADAVEACCNTKNRVVVVTGAAGTGKTTILRMSYDALVEAGYNCVLAAPTGKAAKRIQEVTGIPAMTAHRLLEYTHPGDPDPKTGKPIGYSYPARCRTNPLESDVVFVDEYTMVNMELHRNIFDALPPGAVIRVFGDNNQLQPIEEDHPMGKPQPPSSFVQMLNNVKIPSVVLDTIFRQGKDSGILMNLQQVLRGRTPTRNDQWTMHFTDMPVIELRDYVLECMEQGVDYSSIDNQILTTQNTSWVGTIKLNTMLQGLYHKRTDPSITVPRHDWAKNAEEDAQGKKFIRMFVGDKVIMTSNNYDLNVFNGESGRIIEVNDYGEVIIDFGDKEQAIPPILMVQNRYGKTVEIDPRKSIDLGYAITTHKAQGSEYQRVVYMLNNSTTFMQNRKNLYTACSRAREHVHIITDQRSMHVSLAKMGN